MSTIAPDGADPGRRVPSRTHFLPLVKRTFLGLVVGLLGLAAALPAPLQGPADPGRVPNPSKSAWFLLWTQELVSYSKLFVYPIAGLLVAFLFLPWWPGTRTATRARWFPREQRTATLATAVAFLLIVTLTLVAAFLRGPNWALLAP